MRSLRYFPFNPNYSLSDIENMGLLDASNNRPQDTNKWPSDYEDAYLRGFNASKQRIGEPVTDYGMDVLASLFE